MMKWLPALGVAVIALASRTASAQPSFPGDVQSHLALTYTPGCALCHVGAQSSGTAISPFAVSAKARGLVVGNDNSVAAALDKLASDKVDSDGDGTIDTDELKDCRDPNTPDKSSLGCAGGIPEVAAYGCGATIARSADASPLAIALGAAAVALIALRKKSRTSR